MDFRERLGIEILAAPNKCESGGGGRSDGKLGFHLLLLLFLSFSSAFGVFYYYPTLVSRTGFAPVVLVVLSAAALFHLVRDGETKHNLLFMDAS
jgi:hypothetical protein